MYEELLNNKEIWDLFETEYKRRQYKVKRKNIYYMKQRLIGFLMFLMGIAMPVFLDGDATASILLIPFGIYMMMSRQRLLNVR